jgi:hypothetical protein
MAFGAKGMDSMTIVQTSASSQSSNSLAIHLFIGNCKAIASEGRLPCCFKARTQHSQKRKRDNQQGRQIMSEQDFLATLLLALSGVIVGGARNGGVADRRRFRLGRSCPGSGIVRTRGERK